MEEIREVVIQEVEPVKTEPKPKKKRTPAKPTRVPEDLNDIAPKKMTDKEKDKYILYLRDELQDALLKIDSLEQACDSAYERARHAEEGIKKVVDQANLKLNLVRDNVKVMANNVMTILEK